MYNILARKAEENSNWTEAKKYWQLAGSEDDVKACDMIIEAIRKGDEFRANNESCPVCCVVSSVEIENCPSCKVNKTIAKDKLSPTFLD